MKPFQRSVPFIFMGFSSILLQITVLRLLLSTFSGNELDIGITLSFWLVYVGLGSYVGRRITAKHAFAISFLIIAILSQPTIFAIKAIRPALSLEFGEIVSLSSTIISTAIVLFPLTFIIGLQFPLAILYREELNPAGRIYGLEALGAFIGGVLFTFVIASRLSAMELCLLLSFLNVFIALSVSGKRVFILVLFIPLAFYFSLQKTVGDLPWKSLEISRTVESKYGEIVVIKIRDQSSIYANGQLIYTYPDRQSEEMRTHLPIILHPSPQKILVIGGSLGVLKEFLKYPVTHIDFVELDPKIVDVSLQFLNTEDSEAMQDQRVRIHIEDGRRFIKSVKKPTFDLVVLNLPHPSTANINRFYTIEFFEEVRSTLERGGILGMTLPRSTGYIGRRMQTANGSIYNSLKNVFQYVEVTAEEYGGVFASDEKINIEPQVLEERFKQRKIQTAYFYPYLFHDAFFSFHVEYVKKRLGEIRFLNTDLQPSAYLYNLMLWAEKHGGKSFFRLLEIKERHLVSTLVIILFCLSFFLFKKKKRVINFSVFMAGFAGMSFVIATVLAYQAIYGYVYEMIGILSATFMIGLWMGTTISSQVRRALRVLFYIEFITIILALVSPLFFKAELLFYILILTVGVITGSQFSVANIAAGEREAGGRLYALDLIGSFTGACILSIIVIPLFGILHALFLVAIIKAFSAGMIVSLRRYWF